MLPPRHVESIDTTTCTPVENASTPPPLKYIFSTNLSTTPTVYSSSTTASNSRRRHFPTQKKIAPHRLPPFNPHHIINLCWLTISESLIDDQSIVHPPVTIDEDLTAFFMEVCDADYDELSSLISANITAIHQIATLWPSVLHQHELSTIFIEDTIMILNWWAQKHRLRSHDLLHLTATTFKEICQLWHASTSHRTQRTSKRQQRSHQPQPTRKHRQHHNSHPAPRIPSVSPLVSHTTTPTNDEIYQLAPDIFLLHPDIYHTICQENMSFNDFAVTHPVAATTMLHDYDEPAICSMFKNCTFVDTNTPLSPTPSTSSSSKSDDTYTSLHSFTTNALPSYSSDNNNNDFSAYSNNRSDYSYPSEKDNYWCLVYCCFSQFRHTTLLSSHVSFLIIAFTLSYRLTFPTTQHGGGYCKYVIVYA